MSTYGMMALHKHEFARLALSRMLTLSDRFVFIFDTNAGDEDLFTYAVSHPLCKGWERWDSREGWDPCSWRNRLLRLVNTIAKPGDCCLFWDEDEVPVEGFVGDLVSFQSGAEPTLWMRASAPMPTEDGAILFSGKPYPHQWHMKAFKWKEGLDYGPPYPGFAALPEYYREARYYAKSTFRHFAFYRKRSRSEKMDQLLERGYPSSWFRPPLMRTAASVLNYLSILLNARDYLEIGVREKRTFNAVEVPRKVGVDPMYSCKHMMSSREYFESYQLDRYDLVFIDGDHREQAVYEDLCSAWRIVRDGGAVVLHDCLPASEEAQDDSVFVEELKAPPVGTPWNGGAWKAATQFLMENVDFQAVTLDADHGVCVMMHCPRAVSLPDLGPGPLEYSKHFEFAAKYVLHRSTPEQLMRFVVENVRGRYEPADSVPDPS